MEFVNIENLTTEQIGDLIKKYAPKPEITIIVNNEAIELK